MKQILYIACLLLVLSCDHGVPTESAKYLGAYEGKYVVAENPTGWAEEYSPNLTITLTLYENKTCEVNSGVREWPYKTELDKRQLNYKTSASGLVVYDSDPSQSIFTVLAGEASSDIDPEQDLLNYLGPQIEMSWQGSLGEVWDTYSGMANWPNQMKLDWVDSGIDDILE